MAPGGGSIVWSTYIGGTNTDTGTALAIDNASSVYITGVTSSSSFLGVTRGSDMYADAFVTKLGSAGTLGYVRLVGAASVEDAGTGIAVDPVNQTAYVAGYTSSVAGIGTPGAYRTTGAGVRDAFVAKITAGGAIAWCTHLGGSANDQPGGVALDASNNVYVT